MDKRASNFAVIFAACATRHEAITEIYKAPQRHVGKENRLFQTDGMGNACLFFKNRSFTHVRTVTKVGTLKEYRFLEKSSLQVHIRPYLAIFKCDRPFITYFHIFENKNRTSVYFAARIYYNPVS